ncbi:MAG TPA: hypothetical protein VJQ58_05115 [Burkholderiales bacterium]|nr:hypothetical protein [Burkholderiales bacterium]
MRMLGMVVAAATAIACGQASAHGSLVDVSVYDRSAGRWLPVHRHEGRLYITGKPGHEYQIRLQNRQGEDVLAVVSVDGVNIITGQTADPSQSGYVIGSRSRLDMAGWRRSLSQTAAFYFTALPDSYAARTGRPDDVGVIGVALFRRKAAPPAPAPIAEAESKARGAAADSRLGTGHGRHETSYARHVTFERASSAPAEVITLYYDSHANLVARGVIRERIPVAPRPFPGFVPDPRG